jgi:hypothetical protein
MKSYRGVHVYIEIFLTSALVGGEWSASLPGSFTTASLHLRGLAHRNSQSEAKQ